MGDEVNRRKIEELERQVGELKGDAGRGPLRFEMPLPEATKIIRDAYCNGDAPAFDNINCWLDANDARGTEIIVYCSIAGGGNLDEAEPHLVDGLEIQVRYDADEKHWKCLWGFQHRGTC